MFVRLLEQLIDNAYLFTISNIIIQIIQYALYFSFVKICGFSHN